MRPRFDYRAKAPKAPRKRRGEPNRTEAAYGAYLETLKRSGEILEYYFEAMKFRMATGAYFTPDYMVINADHEWEAHEIKGFMREAAMLRLKVAADRYPIIFKVIRRVKGSWEITEV